MPVGVDQAAHRSALSAGGNTIAVLACGVENVWCGHRDAPFESAWKVHSKDHAVAAPRPPPTRRPRYATIRDSTGLVRGPGGAPGSCSA